MIEDVYDLSLFISIASDDFKPLGNEYLWICHGWE